MAKSPLTPAQKRAAHRARLTQLRIAETTGLRNPDAAERKRKSRRKAREAATQGS